MSRIVISNYNTSTPDSIAKGDSTVVIKNYTQWVVVQTLAIPFRIVLSRRETDRPEIDVRDGRDEAK